MECNVDRKWLEFFIHSFAFFRLKRLIHCFVIKEIIEYRNNN